MENTQFNFLVRLGDNALITGQRMAEWCSNGPYLEEDIALSNISLDYFGEANGWLEMAAKLSDGKSADDLAFLRIETEYQNHLICEQPKGHFGDTVVKMFLYTTFHYFQLEALTESNDEEVAGIAAKSLKEVRYHQQHFGEWLIRLGQGTEESHAKVQGSLNDLWPFTGEMFEYDATDAAAFEAGFGYNPEEFKTKWEQYTLGILNKAGLTTPETLHMYSGSREGVHTEHLGHMLGEMQFLQRAFPGAEW